MKLTFLGTAAAEGFPGVFCNCEACNKARKLKGKNIRTRHQSLINDDLLVDLPADTYFHFLQNDIRADKIGYLLLTHSHSDHFYSHELFMRHAPFAHDMRVPVLKVFCGKGVMEKYIQSGEKENVEFTELNPFERTEVGPYFVTALPARHFSGDGAFIYLIEGEKNILYAHDTGYFYDEVIDFLKKSGIKLDFATMDCTHVDYVTTPLGGHMGIDSATQLVKQLDGVITPETILYFNHFSKNCNPLHERIEALLQDTPFKVAYDGCVAEF